ncbi:hypothetical protein [Clostridium sp.]|uniref:hypothetical protein n=1 Tax=Clostridium sp. TaxID=1506 RepID=UPI003A343C65
MHGGYRIGERTKSKLLDINNSTITIYYLALTTNKLNKREKERILSNCKKIKKTLKELLGTQAK